MDDIITKTTSDFVDFFSKHQIIRAIFFVLLLAAIYLLFKVIRALVLRLTKDKVSKQFNYLIKKAIDYTAFVIIIMTIFDRFGIDISALLGAAGIAGIAIGFAAQTSVSNIISGFFIMSERVFQIGDFIKVDSVSGTVDSFNMLSVRLKTSDGQLVRVPNETMIKKNLVNISHFENRRFDIKINLLYSQDLKRVQDVLLDIVSDNEFALLSPAPVIAFDSFNASTIELMCGVWVKRENFLKLKNSLMVEISSRFVQEGIIVPANQLYVQMDRPAFDSRVNDFQYL